MKIYIVSTTKAPAAGTQLPTLGVHTSQTKASCHFQSVINDRLSIAGKILSDRPGLPDAPERPYFSRRILFEYPDHHQEELLLEVWPTKKPLVNPHR